MLCLDFYLLIIMVINFFQFRGDTKFSSENVFSKRITYILVALYKM